MDKKSTNNRTAKASTKKSVNVGTILKKPVVKLVLLVVVAILVIVLCVNIFGGKKEDKENKLIGYQRLINATDNVYTFLDLEGKVKTYEGYASMSDFYYDTTSVSRLNEEANVTEVALINKNKKQVVKFGTYNKIIQVVGGKFYKVEKDGKYGVIDYKGKTVIAPEYEYISITTVQEATEIVFECQKEGKYYFMNESGKTLLETETSSHSISYANKFNSDYATIIYISIDGVKRYFNLDTAEELFAGQENINISYNIVKSDNKLTFYDKKMKPKVEVETNNDKLADARVYFKKYVLLEERTTTDGNRSYKYTVYDSDFNKVVESESRINLVQDIEGNVYFLVNESDGLKIVNEKKKSEKVPGHEFNGNTYNNLQYLVLSSLDDSYSYDIYDFKGKEIMKGITEYTQRGSALLLNRYDENGTLTRSLLLGTGKELPIEADDSVISNDYYLTIENATTKTVSVVNFKGEMKVEKANGTKVFYVENYVGIQEGENVNIYDVETGKVTFTYAVANYINRDETVNYIELKDGYYTFAGKKILEKK